MNNIPMFSPSQELQQYPDSDRQAELERAFKSNIVREREPYMHVRIRSNGEVAWIIAKRGWSVEHFTPQTQVDFTGADLRLVDFHSANLRGVIFNKADLRGASFQNAHMDERTQLVDIKLIHQERLQNVQWFQTKPQGVPSRTVLGLLYRNPARRKFVSIFSDHASNCLNFSNQLNEIGINAAAITYKIYGMRTERKAQFLAYMFLSWGYSWSVDQMSRYGEKPGRVFYTYFIMILTFAGLYWTITNHSSNPAEHLQILEAFVLSVSSFHGRGFFPTTIKLGDPVAIIAAIEAIFGLFTELVIIATLSRKWYLNK